MMFASLLKFDQTALMCVMVRGADLVLSPAGGTLHLFPTRLLSHPTLRAYKLGFPMSSTPVCSYKIRITITYHWQVMLR